MMTRKINPTPDEKKAEEKVFKLMEYLFLYPLIAGAVVCAFALLHCIFG